MKTSLLVLSLMIANSSFAAIANSTYDVRHTNLLESSITKACGSMINLTQVASNEEVIVIDQGIRDIKFTTVLKGFQRMDQNIFDQFIIRVESNYADMYDHNSKEWGAYSVDSVSCEMQ